MKYDDRPQVGLPDGRYVPGQPYPRPGWAWLLRKVLCRFGWHSPGVESDGWFCAVCLKQLRER